jgi:hypothetical protein
MKENKKVVRMVSEVISKSAKEYAVLKGKGQRVMKSLKNKGKSIIGASVQFEKDVMKGVKLGLKNSTKK